MERVPLIDLAPFYGPPGSGRTALARSVDAACRDIGFLVVTGHRVPAATVAAAMAAYHAPHHPPVTAGEHVMARFRRQHVAAGGGAP